MSENPVKRGRKPSIDPDALSLTAVELFERDGYDETSMDAVAEAAGVSRRSLFRLFPTKSSLLWDGFGQYLEALSALVDATPDDEPAFAAVERCLISALPTDAASLHAVRVRLRIVDSHPDLWSTGSASLLGTRDLIVKLLSRSTSVDRLELLVKADSAASTAFTSMRLWATTGDDESIEESIHRGMATLAAWGH